MIFQTDLKLLSKTITCDFENPLKKAVTKEFERDNIPSKGCEFHRKKCLRSKLIQFGVSSEEVSKMMTKNGCIDILWHITY